MKPGLLFILMLVFVLFVMRPVALAQEDSCPALVSQALNTIGTNCANMAGNSACYGYDSVKAGFAQEQPPDFFARPSDRAVLSALESIQTAPLDLQTGQWGIATMNVQASLPGALPGQNLAFILLGDVAIENAVQPEDTLTLPEKSLDVMAARAALLRRTLEPDSEVVGEVDSGTPLLADGISPEGKFLRVFFMADRLSTAWIALDALEPVPDTSSLPVIGLQSRTPMQAFRFRTGLGGVDCSQAPSVLVVQGPENVQVDINANGADIRIGSTIILRTLPDGSLQIFVLSGGATLNPNSASPIPLPPGFTATCPADLVEVGNCAWAFPRLIAPDEHDLLEALRPLFEKASNLLHYTPSIPELVCASGAGGVICELHFDDPQVALADAAVQCAMGQLPRDTCRVLFPGS